MDGRCRLEREGSAGRRPAALSPADRRKHAAAARRFCHDRDPGSRAAVRNRGQRSAQRACGHARSGSALDTRCAVRAVPPRYPPPRIGRSRSRLSRSDQPAYRCMLARPAGFGPAVRQRPVHHADPSSRAGQGGPGRTGRQEIPPAGRRPARTRSQGPALAARGFAGTRRSAERIWGDPAGRIHGPAGQHQFGNARTSQPTMSISAICCPIAA